MSSKNEVTTEVITISDDEDFEPAPKKTIKLGQGTPLVPAAKSQKTLHKYLDNQLANGAKIRTNVSSASGKRKGENTVSKEDDLIILDAEPSCSSVSMNGGTNYSSMEWNSSKFLGESFGTQSSSSITISACGRGYPPKNNIKESHINLKHSSSSSVTNTKVDCVGFQKGDSKNHCRKSETITRPSVQIDGFPEKKAHNGTSEAQNSGMACYGGVTAAVKDIANKSVSYQLQDSSSTTKSVSFRNSSELKMLLKDEQANEQSNMPTVKSSSVSSIGEVGKSSELQELSKASQRDGEFDKQKALEEFIDFLRPKMSCPDDEKNKIFKKLWSSFHQCKSEYIESPTFQKLIKSLTNNIKIDPSHVFTYISELVKEMNFNKVPKKKCEAGGVDSAPPVAVGVSLSELSASGAASAEASTSSALKKREKELEVEIKRLEKLLEKFNKKIRLLQRRSLGLDELDEDDSVYVRECKLKERCVKIWNLICEKKKCSRSVKRELHKKIHYSGTKYAELNEKIERMVNKKNPFPDFSDIHSLVKNFFEENRFKMSSSQIEDLAKQVFEDFGKELSRRRKLDESVALDEYIIDFEDFGIPSQADEESLKPKFEESAKLFNEKINDIMNYYCAKQEASPEVVADESEHSSPSSASDNDEAEDGGLCSASDSEQETTVTINDARNEHEEQDIPSIDLSD